MRLRFLEEGRPPFVPLASLGELLGASPEEREAASAAASPESWPTSARPSPIASSWSSTPSYTGPLGIGPRGGCAACCGRSSPGG